MDHDVTKPVFSNWARLLSFSLKILVIKLSVKLSGLSISLARWIKAFLLRVIKVFYKSRDLFFLFSSSISKKYSAVLLTLSRSGIIPHDKVYRLKSKQSTLKIEGSVTIPVQFLEKKKGR